MTRGLRLVLAVTITCAGCAPGPKRQVGSVNIVMNPDSTQFAYALDYAYAPVYFPWPPSSQRVEVWTYDLARRTGPRKIGQWSYDPEAKPELLQWTAEGLHIAYRRDAGLKYELVDPGNGHRRSIAAVSWDGRDKDRPRDGDYAYRHTRHVEERYGEFGLWDPVALKLETLFAIPTDSVEGDPRGPRRARARELREDGIQAVDHVDAMSTSHGLILHIRTYARRTAAFARSYRLQLQISSPEQGEESYITVNRLVTLWDTVVTPSPPGDVLNVHVPYSRFWKALRPSRDLVKGDEGMYESYVVTTLVPDSLAGDEDVPNRILKEGLSENRTEVAIPLP